VPVRRQPLAEVLGLRQLANFLAWALLLVFGACRGNWVKPAARRSWLLAVEGPPTFDPPA